MAMTKKQRSAALKNLAKARRAKKSKSGGKRKRKYYPSMHGYGSGHAPKRRKSKSRRKASGRIRPVVIVSGGKFHRPKLSKYFKGPTKINRRRRSKYRRNPGMSLTSVKGIFTPKSITRILSVGGGVLAGSFLTRFLSTGMIPGVSAQVIPASMVATLYKARPVFGIAQIIVGMMLQKQRSPIAKDLGVGMAAVGGFDLLTQILSLAGIVNLPTLGANVQPYLGNAHGRSFLGANVDTNSQIILQGENTPSMSDLVEL